MSNCLSTLLLPTIQFLFILRRFFFHDWMLGWMVDISCFDVDGYLSVYEIPMKERLVSCICCDVFAPLFLCFDVVR